MKTVRKNKFLHYAFILAAFAMLLFSATFALGQKTAYADVKAAYKTVYVGDSIEAAEYTLADGVQAEGLTVVYPSGGIYGGESFVMEQAGCYEVTYYATVGEARVEETRNYIAIRKPQNLIIAEEGMEVGFGKYEVESPYELKKETYGAIVNFKAGQSITFGATIKTSDLTEDYDIFDLIAMPSVFKETDFERLTVHVIDADNPDNYVEIIIDSSNAVDGDGQVSYVRAGANGQQVGGWEGSTYHTVNYGTAVEHSFRALARVGDNRSNHTISEHSLTLSIDHFSKKVYCGPASNTSTDKLLVNDLDDDANYKGNHWNGFTSDEVIVKITAGKFAKSSGAVLIKSFGGYDFSTDIDDEIAPQITVEYEDWDKTPVAQVGKNFPVFPFTAKDALDAQVKTNVWVYYLDENGQKITVDCDGESFFVKYAGAYEIVYTAEDYSKNEAVEKVKILAMERTPNILIGIEESLIEAEVYQTVEIPLASEMQVFGGSGCLEVERVVYAPNQEILDVKNTLQLTKIGEYKVVYTVTDYLGTVAYGVIEINATGTEQPKFVEEPIFESKLIKGFTYALPQFLVVETVAGEIVELPCKTYVNGDLKEGLFKADGEQVEIRYVAEGATGTSEWTRVISVADTEDGKYKNEYFYTEDEVEIVNEKAYLALHFAKDSDLQFIKPLYAKGFGLTLSYAKETTQFTKMAIVLTDAKNRSLSVTAQLFYDSVDDVWSMQLPGYKGKMAYTTSKDLLTFACSADGTKIIDTSGVAIASMLAYDNGEPFQGFSDELYLNIVFEEVKGASSIFIKQICNQTMGYSKSKLEKASDEIKPVILLDGSFVMRQALGAKAYIPTAKAFDVLSQISKFTITVESPKGAVLGEGDAGEPLDITLSEAGYYKVNYYAEDSNGNRETIPYTILVNDTTAPTLTVKNTLKDTYKVGSKVKIPTYSATDNGENCYIQVTLILPNNEMRLLHYSENGEVTSLLDKENELYESAFKADKNTFIVNKKGVYTLRIVAYDEYYNTTIEEIAFEVK